MKRGLSKNLKRGVKNELPAISENAPIQQHVPLPTQQSTNPRENSQNTQENVDEITKETLNVDTDSNHIATSHDKVNIKLQKEIAIGKCAIL